jgi:hypothetical protein
MKRGAVRKPLKVEPAACGRQSIGGHSLAGNSSLQASSPFLRLTRYGGKDRIGFLSLMNLKRIASIVEEILTNKYFG